MIGIRFRKKQTRAAPEGQQLWLIRRRVQKGLTTTLVFVFVCDDFSSFLFPCSGGKWAIRTVDLALGVRLDEAWRLFRGNDGEW